MKTLRNQVNFYLFCTFLFHLNFDPFFLLSFYLLWGTIINTHTHTHMYVFFISFLIFVSIFSFFINFFLSLISLERRTYALFTDTTCNVYQFLIFSHNNNSHNIVQGLKRNNHLVPKLLTRGKTNPNNSRVSRIYSRICMSKQRIEQC